MDYITGNNIQSNHHCNSESKNEDCTEMNNQILQTLTPDSSGTYSNIDPLNYNDNTSEWLLHCSVSDQIVTISFSIA